MTSEKETLEEKQKEEEAEKVVEEEEVEGKEQAEENEEEKAVAKEEDEVGKIDEMEVDTKEDEEGKVEEDDEEKVEEEDGEKVEEEEEEKKKKKKKKKNSVKKVKDEISQVTPTSERPSRERRTVERYTDTVSPFSKPVSIEQGQGTPLKDIPNVAYKLSKRKPDENLQKLHTILFGRRSKQQNLKRNIGMFSGYVWVEDEEEPRRAKVKEKLEKCVKEKLFDFCDLLDIHSNKSETRKDLVAKLLNFLESPHVTTDVLLADREQKGKKHKRKASENKSSGSLEAATEKATKKQKNSQVGEKRKRPLTTEDEEVDDMSAPSESKEDSLGDEDSGIAAKVEYNSGEDGEEEHEEPMEKKPDEISASKKSMKKESGSRSKAKSKAVKESPTDSPRSSGKTTKKSSSLASKKVAAVSDSMVKSKVSSTKKQKVEKGSANVPDSSVKEKASSNKQSSNSKAKVSGIDQVGIRKSIIKAKAEPSKEEMLTVVARILKEVDFNTATLSDILRQLGSHFGMDLMHRKSEVKAIITEVINNMTDEEEEEEDEDDEGGMKAEDDDNDA